MGGTTSTPAAVHVHLGAQGSTLVPDEIVAAPVLTPDVASLVPFGWVCLALIALRMLQREPGERSDAAWSHGLRHVHR